MVNDRGSISLVVCRGHIRASKGTFKIFCGRWFYGKLTFKSNFALWSSFQVEFERVINGLGGQKILSGLNLNMV